MSGKASPDRSQTEHRVGGRGAKSTRPLAHPSWRSRIAARVHTDRYDRMLAVGAPARAGSGLALHSARLTSTAEREAIARSLRRVVDETHRPPNVPAGLRFRITAHRENVVGTEEIIDAITLRLHSPRPVGVRGMARLRVLLSDGTGPMFRRGGGDLHGRLGAALAAL